MAKSAKFPSSSLALRFSSIMHRLPTTAWHETKEIKNFRLLAKHISEPDIALVERYYRMNWPPRTGVNHLRHDLATLINNWSGEVDRARIYCESHPIKPPVRKIIPLPVPPQQQVSAAEIELANETFRKLTGRLPSWVQEKTP